MTPTQYVKLYCACYWGRQWFRWVRWTVNRLEWTPQKLLVEWGARASGRIPSVGPDATHATGQPDGEDEAQQAADYVEDTPGFMVFRPILKWVYYDMRPVEDFRFRIREPGESMTRALFRQNWGFAAGENPKALPQVILNRFHDLLAARLIEEPFYIIRSAGEALNPAAEEGLRIHMEKLRSLRRVQRDLAFVGAETRNQQIRKKTQKRDCNSKKA